MTRGLLPLLVALLLLASTMAGANPISGKYVDNDNCDIVANQDVHIELGTLFPADELITIQTSAPERLVCVGNDGLAAPALLLAFSLGLRRPRTQKRRT